MGATKDKLLEAEYFLGQMEERQAERELFKYNLSAFLSAARSVTLFAQREFKRGRGFEEWYAKKQEEMRKDPAMRFFLKARNRVLKREHAPTRAQINVTVTDTVGITDNLEAVKIRADGTREVVASGKPSPPQPPTPARSEATTEWTWYFEDLPDNVPNKDVVALCAEHVVKLRAFVEECEAKFSSSAYSGLQ